VKFAVKLNKFIILITFDLYKYKTIRRIYGYTKNLMQKSQEKEISNLLIEYAAGNYTVKGKISSNNDDMDMIISGINMLGEELLETNISKEFFASVFNAVNDLIFILSPEGIITDVNRATLDIFKSEYKKITGNSITKYVKEEEAFFSEIRTNLKKNPIPCVKEAIIGASEKQNIIGLMTCSNIVDRFGEFKGYLVNIKDITESKNTEKLILQTTITTQQREHERIADDLHDSLGQELSFIKLMFSNIEKRGEKDKKLLKLINSAREILDESITNLRGICYDLMPSVLIKGGLHSALEDFVEKLNSQNLMQFNYSFSKNIPNFSRDFEVMLYRLIQEFVNNSIKHSDAKNVEIRLKYLKTKGLFLVIEDNGKGFETKKLDIKDEGRGVNNIKAKVIAFDGKYILESKLGKGTKLSLNFKNPTLR